ncbi:hypothetical protein GCM10023108_52960 [Saccharopolyspora hordei]
MPDITLIMINCDPETREARRADLDKRRGSTNLHPVLCANCHSAVVRVAVCEDRIVLINRNHSVTAREGTRQYACLLRPCRVGATPDPERVTRSSLSQRRR